MRAGRLRWIFEPSTRIGSRETETLTITLNGESAQLEDGTTVQELLESRQLAAPGVAVAINRDVVRRAEWPGRSVREGDRVEIIRAAQGG